MTDRTWYLIVVAVFGVILVAVVFGFAVAVAAGQVEESHPVSATVDIDTIVRGDPGYTEVVKTLTPADLEAEPGDVCELVGFGDNGESTHDGTNAHISSNGDSVSILDWERVANTRTEATNGTLTLGATITIAIQVGADKVASGGLEIRFTCNPPGQPPPTTTTTSTQPEPSPSTTTTAPPTTSSSTTSTVPSVTTTTTPPPINGIETGGGACADGGCDGFRLTPLESWVALLAALGLVVVGGAGTARLFADWRDGR